MNKLQEPLSTMVWDIKYRYRRKEKVIDHTIEDTWQRVAKALAKPEKSDERAHWQQAFYDILENFQFLPGGRILAGAGTHHQVTLFNCFVMPIAFDSLPSIFTALKEGAITLQQGGGVGYDFSVLRPQGEMVARTGISASGPVSFMRIWNTMCGVLLSTGARRGAMMGVLRCDHPDIEEFIAAKKEAKELRHFNVSVMISDAFMEAIKKDEPWALVFPITSKMKVEGDIIYRQWGDSLTPQACRVYRYVQARELWEKIIRSAYEYAEPGVLFGDTINRLNNLWYVDHINATNPCGEIPLPSYGACNLGAINLTQFVIAPFSTQAELNWNAIDKTVSVATRLLDNVVDVSRYPLRAQKQAAFSTRRLGLGVTGLADMFVMLGIRYGSPESITFAEKLMKRIAEVTWQTSIELAREKGAFPLFTQDYLRGKFVTTLDVRLQHELARHGVRNSHHNTIAPTGTISLLANNVSNGIEPIFSVHYDRHVRNIEGDIVTFHVKDYAYQQWQAEKNQNTLPPAWVDIHALTPQEHLQIQSAMQAHIDNSISKTINIPRDFPFENMVAVYTQAYQLGLKGCTIFRPNPVTGSVLEVPTEHCCQDDGR